jgi:hypothetical protein
MNLFRLIEFFDIGVIYHLAHLVKLLSNLNLINLGSNFLLLTNRLLLFGLFYLKILIHMIHLFELLMTFI